MKTLNTLKNNILRSIAFLAVIFSLIGITLGEIDPAFITALPPRIMGIMSNFTLLAIPAFIFMGSMLDMPIEKFDKVMHNNIRSNQVLCNLVLPEMISKEDGSIIIISSIAAIKGSPILGAYNISKAADVMIVKNIAAEFGHKNIRANSIAPGLIKTDFAKALWENPDILKTVLSSTPMQRIGMPDEVAGVAVMLASNAGNYINGQTIVVDGGTTIT